MEINKRIKNLKKECRNIFSIIIPNSKNEWFLLLFFIIFYYPLGIYLSLNTVIIDSGKVDGYFSFDNGISIYQGIDKISQYTHPITRILYSPLKSIFVYLQNTNGNIKIFILIVVFFCTLFVSLSNLYVFKYIKNIIQLKISHCYLFILFYAFFSCNIILSFTADTFPFSLFLLSLFFYISSYYLAKGKVLSTFFYTISAFFIGGQTITNAPKALIPILFENNDSENDSKKEKTKEEKKSICKKIIKKMGTVIIINTFLILACLKFNVYQFILVNLKRGYIFSTYNKPNGFLDFWISYFNYFISYFFGGNIFLPSMKVAKNFWGNQTEGIYLNFYDQAYQYIFFFIVFSLFLLGIIRNYKNKLVKILLISFLLDVFYHFIIRLGISESFIYGGHFIFIIPITIAWFMHSLNKKYQKYFICLLSILTIALIINNTYQMSNFIKFAEGFHEGLKYFQK